MTDLKQTLHNIAAAIVDDPSSVVVTVNETETTVNLTLSVAPDDMGMVIKAAAADCPKKVNVDIR